MSLPVGTPTLAASSAAGGGMVERGVTSRIRRLPSLHLCFHLRLLRPARRFLLRQRHPLRRRRRSKPRQFDQSLHRARPRAESRVCPTNPAAACSAPRSSSRPRTKSSARRSRPLGVAERDQLHDEISSLHQQLGQLRSEVAAVHTQLVDDSEAAMLQEVGVYRYTHPLADAVAYKAALDTLQAQIKDAIRTKQAVVGATNWTVNNSAAEGRKMVTDFCKLMLRAYNNEADNACAG